MTFVSYAVKHHDKSISFNNTIIVDPIKDYEDIRKLEGEITIDLLNDGIRGCVTILNWKTI